MKLLKFDAWISEQELFEMEEEMTPTLRKSLDQIGEGFTDEQEIIDAIELLGLELLKPSRSRTSDYTFFDPKTKTKYISYSTGYVRTNTPSKSCFGVETIAKGPIVKSIIDSSRDRLLFILRRALKLKGFYAKWKDSGLGVKEFLHKVRGYIKGGSFGLQIVENIVQKKDK